MTWMCMDSFQCDLLRGWIATSSERGALAQASPLNDSLYVVSHCSALGQTICTNVFTMKQELSKAP